MDYFQVFMLNLHFLQIASSFIIRSVVDNHHFKVWVFLCKNFWQVIYQIIILVTGANDNRNRWQFFFFGWF